MADAPVAAEGLPEDEEKAEPAPAQVAAEEPSSPAPEDEKPPEVALEMPAAVAPDAVPPADEKPPEVSVESPVPEKATEEPAAEEPAAPAAGGDVEMGAVGAAEAAAPSPTLAMWDEPQAVNECDPRHWNKGDVSNVITLAIFAAGVAMRMLMGADDTAAALVLAFGLFGFAGGVTNWLAVKMLFDKIPGLVGSGVIPRRFQDILGALKTMILETFFEEQFLKEYLSTRSKSALEGIDVKGRLAAAMGAEGFDATLARKLEALAATPDGMLLATIAPMFGGFDMMVPMIKPMLATARSIGVAPRALDAAAGVGATDARPLRAEIERVER